MGGLGASWAPVSFVRIVDADAADDPSNADVIVIAKDDDLIMRVPGHNFKIQVSKETLDLLSDAQKLALNETIALSLSSPTLQIAFDHSDANNVPIVVIAVRTESFNAASMQYSPFGSSTKMNISYRMTNDPVHGENGDLTDIVDGSIVYINININELNTGLQGFDLFSVALLHEFMHPSTPDVPGQGGGIETVEHRLVYAAAQTAFQEIFDGHLPRASTPLWSNNGEAKIGTSGSNTITGGSGNDDIAGLAGDDIIYGLQGSNAIFGGSGMDTLVSDGINDYLFGGLDNDVYRSQNGFMSATIKESGGTDRLELNADRFSYTYTKDGNDLIISSISGSDELIVIEDQYEPYGSGKIEYFKMGSHLYPWSVVKSWADNGDGGDIPYSIGLELDNNGMNIMGYLLGMEMSADDASSGVMFSGDTADIILSNIVLSYIGVFNTPEYFDESSIGLTV